MHIRQHALRRARPRQPFQRQRQMGVAGVRRVAQGVADEDLGRADDGPGVFGDGLHIGQIDDAAARGRDFQAKRVDLAMGDGEGDDLDRAARAVDGDGAVQQVQVADRGIVRSCGCLEHIAEAVAQGCARFGIGIALHAGMGVIGHLAEVVDAVDMIGMGMRPDHRIQRRNPCIQHLRHQIGAGIDQHTGHGTALDPVDQDRAAAAAVFRITGVAGAPIAADPRHPPGRAAAQDGDADHALAFQNSRSKLAEVCAAKS